MGHEIIGTVTRVGDKVTEFKTGDRVGVGAQRGSCLQCRECKDDYENYCANSIETYVCYMYSLARRVAEHHHGPLRL